jgi:hypothetical protein
MATQNPNIGIYDHTTGETVVREMNADELADYQAGLEATAKTEADKAQAATAKAALLARLGITTEEAKLLLS